MPKTLLTKTLSVLNKTDILANKNGIRTFNRKGNIFEIMNTIGTRGISGKVITSAQIMTETIFATNHAKFGDRADYCAAISTCSMSPLQQQYQQKNELPSSKQ